MTGDPHGRGVRRAAKRRAEFRRRRVLALFALGVGLLAAVGLAQRTTSSHARHVPAARVRARVATRLSRRHSHSPTDAAIERLLARVPYIAVGGRHRREIALTFDDGPGPYTPQLLKILRRHHVPATFFVVGQSLNSFGETLPVELRDHFVIGDHTENHRPLGQLSERDQRSQLVDQAYRVHLYGGPYPRLFRPPYRSFNQTTLAVARKLHMLMVLWTVDSLDYRQPGAKVIFERVIQGARPGAIMLMHDAGGTRVQTLAALPAIIRRLRAMRYRLVTVPRLILDDPPPKAQPLPSGLG